MFCDHEKLKNEKYIIIKDTHELIDFGWRIPQSRIVLICSGKQKSTNSSDNQTMS